MRGLIRLRREEDGATLAIVALSLVALVGMVVLTVDVGGLVVRRRQMVTANDSAALAAAKAFAATENGAICGSNEPPAQSIATSLADMNATGASLTLFTTDCVEQTVSVEYERAQQLFFAPVLGFGDSATVAATATAHWGQSTSGNPMPIELDPQLTNDCVFEDVDEGIFNPPGPCPTGYWFNNQDLTASSWGLMNLETWSATPNSNCPASGADLLWEWITLDPDSLLELHISSIPMYVCTDGGSQTSTWFTALESMEGEIVLFPVNDPAQMIFGPPTSQEQYAIVAFAPMKIEDVLQGDDPAAYGTPGTAAQSGNCGNNGVPLALDVAGHANLGVRADLECGAPSAVDAIPYTSVEVFSGNGAGRVTYVKCPPIGGTNCDYRYDETSYDLDWVNPATRGGPTKMVKLTWTVNATAATPGACGIQDSDPNAKCLILSWAGPQLIGQDPGPGTGFGAESITLVK